MIAFLTLACGETPTAYISETPGDEYLIEALDILEANSLHRYEVDWEALRAEVLGQAAHPETPEDAYPLIEYALGLVGEVHSRLIRPSEREEGAEAVDAPPLIRLERDDVGFSTGIGVIRVPEAVGPAIDELATFYHRGIERVDTLGVCGWVVDLRRNFGGSMWPMIAGLGPIIGEGVLGSFVDPDSATQVWRYQDGEARLDEATYVTVDGPYTLLEPNPPVAVMVDGFTASSAEATFIAFRGRADAHSIGLPTSGVPTKNTPFYMSDGAILLVTTARMVDRTGHIYSGRITPDHIQSGDRSLEPDRDVTFREALEWLHDHPRCSMYSS